MLAAHGKRSRLIHNQILLQVRLCVQGGTQRRILGSKKPRGDGIVLQIYMLIIVGTMETLIGKSPSITLPGSVSLTAVLNHLLLFVKYLILWSI